MHTGSTVGCTSVLSQNRVVPTSYLPGRIRPASKTSLKWHKKQMLSLIWLQTGSIV